MHYWDGRGSTNWGEDPSRLANGFSFGIEDQ